MVGEEIVKKKFIDFIFILLMILQQKKIREPKENEKIYIHVYLFYKMKRNLFVRVAKAVIGA